MNKWINKSYPKKGSSERQHSHRQGYEEILMQGYLK